MKVLWITYGMFPEVLNYLSGNKSVKGSGGWLLGSARTLSATPGVHLTIAIVNRLIHKRETFSNGINDFELIPFGKGFDTYHTKYDKTWHSITEKVKPDIVHIHGVESTLALTYLRACPDQKTVVSIQGMAGIISRYYYEGLNSFEIIKNLTLRDILTCKSIFFYKKDFARRGKYEAETLRLAKHVIGRTSWDRAHTWSVNPECNYHFCNETLRDEFYGPRWKYSGCEPFTIFASQGTAPFKGLHFLLKALPIILKHFPDTKLKIAGAAPVKGVLSIRSKTGYQKYIDKLITKYNLSETVEYTGPLDAQQMVDAYLSCNVFVCPSTIENSSNSVAEAQLIGVPLIASFTGGIPDMIPDEHCGYLIRVGEVEMLAKAITDIFNDSKAFDNSTMRSVALARHDRDRNAAKTIDIYKEIIE